MSRVKTVISEQGLKNPSVARMPIGLPMDTERFSRSLCNGLASTPWWCGRPSLPIWRIDPTVQGIGSAACGICVALIWLRVRSQSNRSCDPSAECFHE